MRRFLLDTHVLLWWRDASALLSPFADDFETVLREERFGLLGISFQHLRCLNALPSLHRDPFDRLLIAQAVAENLPIVTGDTAFAAYGPILIW